MNTVHVGLGLIGQRVASTGLREGHYRPVAAVDPAPHLVGRDLGELLGGAHSGVTVRATLAEALGAASAPPSLALHARSSPRRACAARTWPSRSTAPPPRPAGGSSARA
jgi:hypothetical protein